MVGTPCPCAMHELMVLTAPGGSIGVMLRPPCANTREQLVTDLLLASRAVLGC